MLYYRQVPNLSQTNLNEIYASQTASIERGGHPDVEFLHCSRTCVGMNVRRAWRTIARGAAKPWEPSGPAVRKTSVAYPRKQSKLALFEKLRVATLYGRLPTSPGSLAHNRLSHSSGTVRNLSLKPPNTSENFKRCASCSQTLAPFSHTSQTNWP